MAQEQSYELIKFMIKEDISFGYDGISKEYKVYDDVIEVYVYDKDLDQAMKKFIIAVSDRYSKNFVKKLYKMAGM